MTDGRVVEDLAAGGLAVPPELAGPLFPHGHGEAAAAFSPGHERARGVEWGGVHETVRLLQGQSGTAAVHQCSFPVQVRPPPPPARDQKGAIRGQRESRNIKSFSYECLLFHSCDHPL